MKKAELDFKSAESLFDFETLQAHALFKKHSTMKQAFDIATKMRAQNLVLTHFSAKYPKVREFRKGFMYVAEDRSLHSTIALHKHKH